MMRIPGRSRSALPDAWPLVLCHGKGPLCRVPA
jgi:hypothetical protein